MEKEKISTSYIRVTKKLASINKKMRTYGTNQALHPAEIHVIKTIKEHPNIHVTGLAHIIGVTKGDVSQIIIKLEKKGMITKSPDQNNLSRIILKLTKKGETAYKNHQDLHNKIQSLFSDTLESFSEDDKKLLENFLDKLESSIDEFEKK